MLKKFALQEIVMQLVGPIQATGEHYADTERLENLKVLTELVDRLIYDIDALLPNSRRPEASMKAIGTHAAEFLNNLGIKE